LCRAKTQLRIAINIIVGYARAMINKLVMVDIPGPTLDTATRAHLTRYQPGGVILFRKNFESIEQGQALVLELREILGDDLLVAIDAEGGGVWRTGFLPHAPSAMSLGAGDDEALTRDVGAAVARGLRSMGINWNFAPVLDVNNNPLNPVISDRSFGEDPTQVARLGLAWAQGLMSGGVAACAKHFPGHGDTFLDSHLALPTVTRNLEGLEEYELVPFRAAAPTLPSIMTAHIVYPSIDPDLPATLSKKILTDLLRERAGYRGVIVTDSMGMKAIDDRWGRGAAAVQSVLAGADMLEALGSIQAQVQTFEALEQAEKDGSISRARIEKSLERLRGMAHRFPIAPIEYSTDHMNADSGLMQRAWRRGITAFGEPRIPALGSSITLVAADEIPGENVAELGIGGDQLARALSRIYDVKTVLYPFKHPLEAVPAVEQLTGPVVFASTSRHRLTTDAKTLARAANPVLHLALWNAYSVADVPAPAIVTFGFRPEAIEALLEVLQGSSIVGKSPVQFG
jgi:beta-N-acetylhexosaminidase